MPANTLMLLYDPLHLIFVHMLHATHDIFVIQDAWIKKCHDIRVLIFLGKLKFFDVIYTVIRSELEASHLLSGSLC